MYAEYQSDSMDLKKKKELLYVEKLNASIYFYSMLVISLMENITPIHLKLLFMLPQKYLSSFDGKLINGSNVGLRLTI